MGILKGISYGDKICDFWIGPTGDQIYHFHEPYPSIEELPAMVGVHPSYKKQADRGYAFLFVRSNNPVWHKTIIYSFVHAFQGGHLYLGNGKRPPGNAFSEIPDSLKNVHNVLLQYNGVEHSCENTLSIDAENRFLAKVALGIGCKFIGQSFMGSRMAKKLREYMWTKELSKRKDIPIHGTNFTQPVGDREETAEFFGLDGAIVLALMNLHDCVALTLCVYGNTAVLKLEKDGDDYQEEIGNGITFVIVPGLNKVVGPMKHMHFLQHRFGMGKPDPELSALMEKLENRRVLPPVMI